MAFYPSIHGSRMVLGGEAPAGITKVQTKPYDGSLLGGLSILNGPVQIGVAPLAVPPLGTVFIGPNPPTSGPTSLAGLHVLHPVLGINIYSPIALQHFGILNGFGITNKFAPVFHYRTTTLLDVLLKLGKSVETGGTIKAEPSINESTPSRQTAGNWTHAGNITATNFTGNINVQSWKGFDIKHPKKPNRRIRHICVEGPEAAIYIRGTLKGSNVIELPDYWDGLVDIESISVHLTPIGSYQELYVDKIEWGKKVIVKNNQGSAINCYYRVEAARIDGEPLIVEYDGETPADYPGDPTQYSISGHDYGRKD